VLGVDESVIHVGENLELVGHSQVIAIGRQSVGDYSLSYLLLGEWVDHVVFPGHLANPAVALQHETPFRKFGNCVIW
jgi:hypothetical protein